MKLVRNALVAGALVAPIVVSAAGVGWAQASTLDVAAKMTGSWRLNRELSPGFRDAGPDGGRRGRRGGAPAFQMVAAQRGGRGGGTGSAEGGGERPSVTSVEAAAQAALTTIQQLPVEFTIEATERAITIVEPRGSSHFQIDNKSTDVEVPGNATIKIKSRWDRTTLRQEFSSVQQVLKRSWSIDENGRLVARQRIESVSFSSKETEAVFDKQ